MSLIFGRQRNKQRKGRPSLKLRADITFRLRKKERDSSEQPPAAGKVYLARNWLTTAGQPGWDNPAALSRQLASRRYIAQLDDMTHSDDGYAPTIEKRIRRATEDQRSTHAMDTDVGPAVNPGDGAVVRVPGNPRSPGDGAADAAATGATVCGVISSGADVTGDAVIRTGGAATGVGVGSTDTGGATTGVGVGSTGRGVGGSTGIGAGVTGTDVTGAFVARGVGGT